jgi:hypothetical protein
MQLGQDSRLRGADPGDAAFVQCGGQWSGLAAWNGPETAPVSRLVDIRWVFPSSDAAIAYHRATLQTNSEGLPTVAGAPAVGSECHVFGGTTRDPVFGVEITSLMYVFRAGSVVAKLYVAEGDRATQAGTRLSLELARAHAERVLKRIESATHPATVFETPAVRLPQPPAMSANPLGVTPGAVTIKKGSTGAKVLTVLGGGALLLSLAGLAVSALLPAMSSGVSVEEALFGIIPAVACSALSLLVTVIGLVWLFKSRKRAG